MKPQTAVTPMTQITTKSFSTKEIQPLPWAAAAGLSAIALFAAAKLAGRVRRRPVELRGKIALITGGSRGLGLALAEELGEYGCKVALVARDESELEEAASGLRARGIEAAVFPCDITQFAGIGPLIDRVLGRFGTIDILVNDAGLIKVAPLDNMARTDFDEAMNLMFWAPVNLTFAVLPHMRKQGGGHIVNITSVGGRVSIPHLLPYSCAKFAFVGFSTGLSSELDPERVHVMTVVPGLMRTGSYLNAQFKGQREKEFAWFSLLGNLPGLSISAEESARTIRQSLQKRELTCTISLPAKILTHAEALLPEATRAVMQLTSRLLPGPHQNSGEAPGKALNQRFGNLFQALTSLGKVAARGLNQ
jgi:short-subunit dehydrogenase